MATELLNPSDVDLSSSRRSLLLVWQNPESRLFTKVGRLDVLADSRFAFRYLPDAAATNFTLDDYPNRDAMYVSESLPAFFANRVMSSRRPGYVDYLEWLGVDDLDDAEVPVELLARTGGERQTDTFHVVDVPEVLGHRFSSRFFVSGVRHLDNADEVLASIDAGTQLALELEADNPVNGSAVLINTLDGSKVGYVPDWLCVDVGALVASGWRFRATAERVNRDAPAHVKVLCRIDAELA